MQQAVLLKAFLQLLDGLRTNALDAQQVVLGVADQVGNRLDAGLAELVAQRCDTPRSS